MKILHLLYSGLGGHGNVFFSLVKADKDKLFQQEALFAGVEELRPAYQQQCAEHSIVYNYLKKRPGFDIGFYFRLIRQIKRAKPQIIFLHGSANVVPARIASFFYRGHKMTIVRETQSNELKTKRDWKMLRLALRYADRIVFLSNEYNGEVKKQLAGLYRSKKIAVIPNGIDLELYSSVERLNNGEMVLGMLGRIVIIKDHDTLLQAFAMVKQRQPQRTMKLRIAGDGEYRSVLEKKATELNIADNVEFTGTLDEKELVSFIQSLDIYVHASLGETMSTAIMQAMACKKPIVASDVPGINNMIINKETGWLVPVKDAPAMATALFQLVNDAALAAELAANAHRFALDHYSNTIMFNRYKELFNS